ncbi:hypothetical protein GBAR_LOCUS14558 [Geodia barretti]|uniref:Fibronectin type-III domain-containing protein n=1 Tax=Geodia barretti TaxID=519541 RepID=A0AA35S7Z5_GEOBA|nr:hypothetical protein GBAR_LOCUS14558 [Geodia barretti]
MTGGNGVTISEYRVTVDGGVTQTVGHDDSRDVFTATITVPQFNTSYSVSVTAINSCGLSSQPANATVFIDARVPPQPTVQSLVMYCDLPLSGGRPVVLNWTEGEREVGVVYPGEEMATVDLTPGGTICSLLSTPNTSCTATITSDCNNYNISVTLSNDIGSSQPVSIIFNAAPVEVEEGESPSGGPAVVVSLNPLCRSVPYTVGLSFGVRENSGETCLPQQNVTTNILPGTPVILPINVTTLPLADGQQYCFTVPQLNIEGDLPTASTSTCTDTREEKESISTGVAVAISTIITLLVSLPVGVVIGSCGTLFAIRRGGERGERKKKKREELVAAIYEEPVHSVETAIPLSENQAYGQVSSQR